MSRSTSSVITGSILAVLLLLFLCSVAEVLLLLFISVLFSLYLGAITDTLQRRLRLPRSVGLLAAVLVTALGLVGVAYLMVPPVARQTQELLQALPPELERWEAWLLALAERSPLAIQLLGPIQEGQSYVGNILQEIGGYFRGIVPYVFSGMQFMIHVVSVFVMGVYMALRPALYREGCIGLAPPGPRELGRDRLSARAGAPARAVPRGVHPARACRAPRTGPPPALRPRPHAARLDRRPAPRDVLPGPAHLGRPRSARRALRPRLRRLHRRRRDHPVLRHPDLHAPARPLRARTAGAGHRDAGHRARRHRPPRRGQPHRAHDHGAAGPAPARAAPAQRPDHGPPPPGDRPARRRARARHRHGRRAAHLRAPRARGQRLPPRDPRPAARSPAASGRERARPPRGTAGDVAGGAGELKGQPSLAT